MRRIRRQRGFASFSAVVLCGTTAIALTALATVTILQVQRARDAATDAQLRQLLIAGHTYLDALGASENRLGPQIVVTLPDTLASEGSLLRIDFGTNSSGMIATITATHQDRLASTTLIYDEKEANWRPKSVAMP